MALAEDRAAGRNALLPGNGRHMDPFVIVGIFVRFDLLDNKAKRCRERANIHLVDLLAADAFQKSFEDHAGNWIGRQLGRFPAVSHDELVVALWRELRDKPSEFLRQREIRPYETVSLGVEVR